MKKTWPAPAKLNLMLRIIGRRTDGYHELQTVFQFLDFSDHLTFTVIEEDAIKREHDIPGVSEADDLVLKAARLLKEVTGVKTGISIHLEKKLPIGGGIGGGSSDAATTLYALNQIWETGLSIERLQELGLQLGADVPVFLHGHAVWAEGVGEKFTDVNPAENWYLVLKPSCFVSTAAVFSDENLPRNDNKITISDFIKGERGNSCLKIVKKSYPEVAQAIQWLLQFAPAYLTGTGACVFAAFEAEQEALEILAKVPKQYTAFVAKGQNKSPLFR